jgi:hypothetical protein
VLTLYVSTDAHADLNEVRARNTDAAAASFAAAWKRAAGWISRAAGVGIDADVLLRGPDPRTTVRRLATVDALVRLGMDTEDAEVFLDDLWQALHSCICDHRPGRWTADRAACRRAGARLAASLSSLPTPAGALDAR